MSSTEINSPNSDLNSSCNSLSTESNSEDEVSVNKKRKAQKQPDTHKALSEVSAKLRTETSDGKRRRFPHVEAMSVFLEADKKESLQTIVSKIQSQFSEFVTLMNEKLHVSLSKTFSIQFHEKETLLPLLQRKLAPFKRLTVGFKELRVFLNEDQSRTFVSLEVSSGKQQLISMIRAIDQALLLHKKEAFYKDAQPHLSIGWIAGNKSKDINEILEELNLREIEEHGEAITQVVCRIGKLDHYIWDGNAKIATRSTEK